LSGKGKFGIKLFLQQFLYPGHVFVLRLSKQSDTQNPFIGTKNT
jgi:hypothetical protein